MKALSGQVRPENVRYALAREDSLLAPGLFADPH